MKLRIISEMPLVGYNIDKSQNSNAFDPQSQRVLNHPKVLRMLSQKLSSDFNIIIIADPGLFNKPVVKNTNNEVKLDDDYYKSAGINPSLVKQSITFILTGDNARNGDRLTPWIILHQLGECVVLSGMIYDHVWSKYGKLLNRLNTTPFKDGKTLGDEDFRAYFHLFKMKSARDRWSPENYDYSAELVTEYLWHGGRIRINYPDGFDKTEIDQFKLDLETATQTALEKMIGRSFVNLAS